MSLPKQFEITEGEMWTLWRTDGIKHEKTQTIDHLWLSEKLDGTPVWTRVQN